MNGKLPFLPPTVGFGCLDVRDFAAGALLRRARRLGTPIPPQRRERDGEAVSRERRRRGKRQAAAPGRQRFSSRLWSVLWRGSAACAAGRRPSRARRCRSSAATRGTTRRAHARSWDGRRGRCGNARGHRSLVARASIVAAAHSRCFMRRLTSSVIVHR